MATYKVIQDIEAEDKLVGPLGFRQFVYFLIAAFLGYLTFISIAKGVPFLAVIFVPPMLFCLFFAWPWTPDQPTEVWALAKIRYYFKPRKRIWNQSGVKELVTITVPKRIQRNYTDGLSQTEVRSRLSALASTIDTRGWAVKNSNVNLSPSVFRPATSDRLLDFTSMPQQVSNLDIRADDDILDADNNQAASQMSAMIDAATRAHRQDLVNLMQQPAAAPVAEPMPNWFAQSYGQQTGQPQLGVLPSVVDTSGGALTPALPTIPVNVPAKLVNQHLKTINPAPTEPVQAQPAPVAIELPKPAPQPVPSRVDPAILNLSRDNNLNVSTLAREAHRAKGEDDNEVVISLH